MPGAFAHLTVVDQLRSDAYLDGLNMLEIAKAAVLDNGRFNDLGAVSPDYPYLTFTDGDQKHWADNMHYHDVGNTLRRLLRGARELSPPARDMTLAWCLGYIAHVVTDMTIHPVVEFKVGKYEENQDAHRICEMNQDVHIFRRLNTGEVTVAEHLDNGLCQCGDPSDSDRLHPIIAELWRDALLDIFPDTQTQFGDPRVDAWHEWFIRAVDGIAEEGNALGFIPIARHVARDAGLVYPNEDEIDKQFTGELDTPEGAMFYDAIFDRAIANVGEAWSAAAGYVLDGDETAVQMFGDWNLDTGTIPDQKYVFWAGSRPEHLR